VQAGELGPYPAGDGSGLSWHAFASPHLAAWLRSVQVGPGLGKWAAWVPEHPCSDISAWVEASGCQRGEEEAAAQAGYRWCERLGLS
jgi:hypothetical protein